MRRLPAAEAWSGVDRLNAAKARMVAQGLRLDAPAPTASIGVRLLARAPKHPCDDLALEAALREEAMLPSPLGEVGRQLAEAFAPGGKGTLALAFRERLHQWRPDLGRHPVAIELLLDPPTAVTIGAALDQAFDETLLRQVTLSPKILQQGIELLFALRMRSEFSPQLDRAVLAIGQKTDGPGFQRDAPPRTCPAAQAATSAFPPGLPATP